MNIILLEPQDWLDDHTVKLSDHRHQHLVSVLDAKVGDTVRVGKVGGLCGSGKIISQATLSTCLTVTLDRQPPNRHPFTVVLALPRPKMLRRVLRSCAEYGVTDIHLIHSWRVEKSFWQSPLLKDANVLAALRAGMERSGDTVAPSVHTHRRFRPFVEDELASIANGRPIYITHPGDYPKLESDRGQPAVVMIGPEGGFIPFEVELAMAQGAEPRALGQRILSVDTALNGILAREMS